MAAAASADELHAAAIEELNYGPKLNTAALLGEGCENRLLAGKLFLDLPDGRKHRVLCKFAVDPGCRGVDLGLVMTKRQAKALGLSKYGGIVRHKNTKFARAADGTLLQLVQMWPSAIVLVPLYKSGGQGSEQGQASAPAALRKMPLTIWAADIEGTVACRIGGGSSGGSSGGSQGGAATVATFSTDSDDLSVCWPEAAANSSSNVDEGVVSAHADYSKEGYQALHSPSSTEDMPIALLGSTGLSTLWLKADVEHKLVYSVQPKMSLGMGIFGPIR